MPFLQVRTEKEMHCEMVIFLRAKFQIGIMVFNETTLFEESRKFLKLIIIWCCEECLKYFAHKVQSSAN